MEQRRIDPFGISIVDYRPFTLVDPTKKLNLRDATTKGSIKKVVFHCTDASGWTPERLSKFFVDERKFPICGYHYYVQENEVFHMVGDNVITYHASGHNKASVAFSIDYNPTISDKLNQNPLPTIIDRAIRTASHLCLKHNVPPIKGSLAGHRELFGTGFIKDRNDRPHLLKTCPGLRINLDAFRYSVARMIQTYLKEVHDSTLVIDGIWGPSTQKVFDLA